MAPRPESDRAGTFDHGAVAGLETRLLDGMKTSAEITHYAIQNKLVD